MDLMNIKLCIYLYAYDAGDSPWFTFAKNLSLVRTHFSSLNGLSPWLFLTFLENLFDSNYFLSSSWIILACTRVFPLLSSSGFKSLLKRLIFIVGGLVEILWGSQVESLCDFHPFFNFFTDLFIRSTWKFSQNHRKMKPLLTFTIEIFFKRNSSDQYRFFFSFIYIKI